MKEYWIEGTLGGNWEDVMIGTILINDPSKIYYLLNPVHVIEYSAYKSLRIENDKLKEIIKEQEIESTKNLAQIIDLSWSNQQLTEILRKNNLIEAYEESTCVHTSLKD